MEKETQSVEGALLMSMLGYHVTALQQLQDKIDNVATFEVELAKAHVLLNMGQTQDALNALDCIGVPKKLKDQYILQQAFSRAFLQNNERKPA